MRIFIHRTDAPAEGDFWLNVVVDVDGDGRWDLEAEWAVRNCVVPATGLENETIECDATGSSLAPSPNGWLRVLLADQQAPSDGWDGSAFFEPGEALGEVEDYFQHSVPTPIPPPSPTPTPSPTPDPSTSGQSFPDPVGDSQVMNDSGNFPGIALPHDRSDIREVRSMWITEDDQSFLVFWIFRVKTKRSDSSAIQVFLTIGEDALIRVLAWQDHEEEVTEQVFDEKGEISDSGVTFEVFNNGGQVHIKIPAEQVGEADSFLVRSFDRVNREDDRGFDSTEYLPIPVP